jgi:hypothetical protein
LYLVSFAEIVEHQPRVTHQKPKLKNGKFVSQSLKLSYNAFQDIDGLYDWVEQNFDQPEQITSLDLSFNCLTNVPAVSEH